MLSVFFGASMSAFFTPYVLTTILKEYHATVFQIALIVVIIRAGGFVALPVAVLCSNFNHKRVCISLHLVAVTSLIVFPIVILYPDIAKIGIPATLLSAYAVSQIFTMSAAGPASAWFKEILPGNIQATFIGKRSALASLVIGCLTPAIGFCMERYSLVGLDKKTLYVIFFSFAIVLGYTDMYFLGKVKRSSSMAKIKLRKTFQKVASVWKNRDIWNASTIPVIANVGTFLITPFLILLFYDLGMDKFKVGMVAGLSTLGIAAGLVIGGYFSDRLLVKKIFILSSLLRTFCHLCFFVLTILVFSSELPEMAIFVTLSVVAPLAAFSQSCIQAAHVKYAYNTVKDGSSIPFVFIAFIQNFVVLIIMACAAKFGAFLSSNADILREHLWDGFHYIQILLLCSIILSPLCCIYLCRARVYKNVSLS